ncbi:MAG: ion channel [Candidatus Latescibacterota bacterium]
MFFQIWLHLVQKIARNRYRRLVVLSALVVVIGVFGIRFFEFGRNEQFTSFQDSLWWVFVTVTTVGFGDKVPITVGGRIVAVLVMFFGIGFLGLLISTITGELFDRKLKEERGMNQITTKGHIVLCNWNFKAEDIISELRSDPKSAEMPIVIVAKTEKKPVDDENIFFVRGDPTGETVLLRAHIEEAATAIVLLDEEVEPEARDAKAILTVLTIESLSPEVYTCVELLDPENVQHARRARADEIVVTGELSSRLLVRSALDHGISDVVSELVCGSYGNAFYMVDVPSAYVGRTMEELFGVLKREYNTILIALEHDGKSITNPKLSVVTCQGDRLVVLAEERPVFEKR